MDNIKALSAKAQTPAGLSRTECDQLISAVTRLQKELEWCHGLIDQITLAAYRYRTSDQNPSAKDFNWASTACVTPARPGPAKGTKADLTRPRHEAPGAEHSATKNAPKMLSIKDFMAMTNICRATVYHMIERGELPRPNRLGPRRLFWPEQVIREWFEQRGIVY
jgi:prophage regulatory protein